MLEIESEKATSINLILDKFYLPEGGELNFYNGNHTMVMGPLTHYHNRKSKVYATDLLQGSKMVLEYYEPRSVINKGEIHISVVVHGFLDAFQDQGAEFESPEYFKGQGIDDSGTSSLYGDAASCAINVKCSSGGNYQAETDAVGLMIWGAIRFGSGALVNNTARNGRGLFMTANHTTAYSHVDEFVYRFQYKSSSCSGGDGPTHFTLSGSSSAVGGSGSNDLALHFLIENPSTAPNLAGAKVTYLGWNRTTANPTSVATLSHPRGDVMKIAFGGPATQSTSNNSPVWSYKLTSGIHESTSSGGPTFDQNRRLIGVIKGAAQTLTCSNYNTIQSYSSRLYSAWYIFKSYLDPSNTNETSIAHYVRPCPAPAGISGLNTIEVASTYTYSVVNPIAGMTYQWVVDYGTIVFNQNNSVVIEPQCGATTLMAIRVRAVSGCGTSNYFTRFINLNCSNYLSVYPNPASSQVTVEFSQNTMETEASFNEFVPFLQGPTSAPMEASAITTKVNKFKVQIVNEQQQVLLEESRVGSKVTLNVDDLPNGSYFLRSWFNDKAIEPKHLVIKK